MANLGTAYIKIAPDLTGVQSKISNSINKAASSSQTTKGISGIGAVAAGAIGGVVASVTTKAIGMVTDSIGSAVKRVDTLNNAPKILQNLGFSAEDSSTSIKSLADGLKGLPSRLDEMAQNLVSVTSASGLGVKEAKNLTLAFNNMALAGGGGREGAATAFEALTTAMGKGKFDLDQYQRLVKVMPAQLSQMAEHLLGSGKTAMDLYEAMKTGKVSMKDFQNAVIELDQKGGDSFASFSNQAKDATKGMQTGWDNMQAAITRGVGKIITSVGSENISNTISNIGKGFEEALSFIADVIPPTIDIIKSFGKAIADKLEDPINKLKETFENAVMFIDDAITGIQGILNGGITSEDLDGGFFGVVMRFAESLIAMFDNMKRIFTTVFNALKPVFEDTLNTVGNQLEPVMNSIINLFKQWWDYAKALFPVLKVVAIVVGAAIVSAIYLLLQAIKLVLPILNFGIRILGDTFAVTAAIIRGITGIIGGVINFIKSNWQAVIGFIIAGPIGAVVGLIIKHWDTIKNGVIGVKDMIVDTFRSVVDKIKGFFSGLWTGIANGLRSILNNVLHLPLKIPEISIAGKKILDGRTLIPALAEGGIVTSPTLAMIGEGNEPEAVIPLSKLGNMQGTTINQTNNVYTEIDMNIINRNLIWELNRA